VLCAFAANFPGAHAICAIAPVALTKNPGDAGVQKYAPELAAKVPGAQGEQLAAVAASEALPALHVLQ
jgi:hypothetical protein